ncbi:MAG: putative addiction module antidote protein [Desulfobacterales bacterium]|nr:putative addiction module antidote protein [Desulfobacterales bacterium]
MKTYRKHKDFFLEELQSEEAIKAYLEIAFENLEQDKDFKAFLLAIRTIAEAKGGINALALKTAFTRQSIYKALSLKGNPRLDTLWAILNALGYTLTLKTLKA